MDTRGDSSPLPRMEISFQSMRLQGRDRKGPTFWDNVAELLNKNESVKEEISTDKVKSHFSRVSKSVSKFCGCVAAIERKYTSGETPEDKVRLIRSSPTSAASPSRSQSSVLVSLP
ncbi:hypothetical protein [Parasitella parasitica]|uniref:Myb/SANT-like domain-containing protein n=1 Tax=Parasitella parasitica TaxID=35722 RepID=A0A0B7NBC3_9FUNG|nr:hypothetical protein [Parasitella parasitica]